MRRFLEGMKLVTIYLKQEGVSQQPRKMKKKEKLVLSHNNGVATLQGRIAQSGCYVHRRGGVHLSV